MSDFEHAAPESNWFSVQSKWAARPDVSVGTVIDQGIHPITVYDARRDDVVEFVDHQLFGRLMVRTQFADSMHCRWIATPN